MCPFPVVEFANGEKRTITPHAYTKKWNNGTEVSWHQVPLMLGWGITIHSCQSMTLDAATMDLSNCFETGQFYVAMSRVRDWNSVRLQDYNRKSIKTDREAVEYYARLEHH